MLVDRDQVIVDHDQVSLLLDATRTGQNRRVDRDIDRARQRDEQIGERDAVSRSALECFLRRVGNARGVVEGEVVLVEQEELQVSQTLHRRPPAGDTTGDLLHFTGETEGVVDRVRVDPACFDRPVPASVEGAGFLGGSHDRKRAKPGDCQEDQCADPQRGVPRISMATRTRLHRRARCVDWLLDGHDDKKPIHHHFPTGREPTYCSPGARIKPAARRRWTATRG